MFSVWLSVPDAQCTAHVNYYSAAISSPVGCVYFCTFILAYCASNSATYLLPFVIIVTDAVLFAISPSVVCTFL
jgi:hypothetical protein